MKKINYYFIGEGSSDTSLVDHIDAMLVEAGFDEVYSDAPDIGLIEPSAGNSVGEKIDALIRWDPNVKTFFIHRDADNAGYDARINEIHRQTAHLPGYVIIPVIPVKILESWLILDEQAIKSVIGHPGSKVKLNLPNPKHVESRSNAKELLFEAMDKACMLSGKKLKKFQKSHNKFRHMLVQNLHPDGPVAQTTSHQKLRALIVQLAENNH